MPSGGLSRDALGQPLLIRWTRLVGDFVGQGYVASLEAAIDLVDLFQRRGSRLPSATPAEYGSDRNATGKLQESDTRNATAVEIEIGNAHKTLTRKCMGGRGLELTKHKGKPMNAYMQTRIQ